MDALGEKVRFRTSRINGSMSLEVLALELVRRSGNERARLLLEKVLSHPEHLTERQSRFRHPLEVAAAE